VTSRKLWPRFSEKVPGFIFDRPIRCLTPTQLSPDRLRLTNLREQIFEDMAGKARNLGGQIIAEEAALDMAFRAGTIDDTARRNRRPKSR